MEPGNIVEFIDRQKIVRAVVTEVKKHRLRLLTEANRETKISATRILYKPGNPRLDLSLGRDKLAESLKEIAAKRKDLARSVDIKELWEVLHTEQEWIDLETMTDFAFPDAEEEDAAGAVVQAFFDDRLYFKFDGDRFFPHTPEQVAHLQAEQAEAERRERITRQGGEWLRQVLNNHHAGETLSPEARQYARILQSFYLFDKESESAHLARAMLERAGVNDPELIFDLLVKLGIWGPDENVTLYRYEVPVDFPEPVLDQTRQLLSQEADWQAADGRTDLSHLPLFTIDGQATLDFDDALSIEKTDGGYRLGVHIADVSHYVKPGDPLDQAALQRASSIYMPDQKIPMIPPDLAEDLCSLRAGELRPAMSTMIRLSPEAEVLDYEIFPSIIRIQDQLSYHEANLLAEEDPKFIQLYEIARKFRKKRLAQGAVQISLPEINIWFDESGALCVNRISRESPGRLLVAELMIMANWLMARFLAKHGIPAIFRSQPDPRERLYEEEGSLYQNWMQRKLLSRFVLSPGPEHHAGLGLDAYVTATSPIRKYSDLVTQRQLRAIFGLDSPYSTEDMEKLIVALREPMSQVAQLQVRRKRYWLLKHLESRIGETEEVMVLGKRKNGYLALMTEYMTECLVPATTGVSLKPEALISVRIQHVDARKDLLSVFMA